MSLDPLLLEILACPCPAHAPLRSDALAGEPVLVCTSCGLAFPVRDEIPVMLLDEAVPFGGAVQTGDVQTGAVQTGDVQTGAVQTDPRPRDAVGDATGDVETPVPSSS